jgi:hypothetical protein
LLQEFRQKTVGVDPRKQEIKWGSQKLLRLLERSLKEVLEVAHIRIFIDAVDECHSADAREFLFLFQQTVSFPMDNAAYRGYVSESQCAVCYSCRDDAFIKHDVNPSIHVQKENSKDIRIYTKSAFHVAGIPDLAHVAQPLIDEIVMRADGIFLWAVLVIQQGIEDLQQHMPVDQVLTRLSRLPRGLTVLYLEIMSRLRDKHPARSLKLLQWSCFWKTPGRRLDTTSDMFHFMGTSSNVPSRFSLRNLRDFMNFDPQLGTFQPKDSETGESIYTWNDKMMECEMKRLSGGLVCFDDDKGVALVHMSVKDFLVVHGFHILSGNFLGNTYRIVLDSHALLGMACFAYLNVSTRDYICSIDAGSNQSMGQDILHPESSRESVRYALNHAFAHLSMGEPSAADFLTVQSCLRPVLEIETVWVRLLQSELPGILENVYSFPATWSPEDVSIPLGTSILQVLATIYNLPTLLGWLLETSDDVPFPILSKGALRGGNDLVNSSGRMLQKMLYLAAKEGYRKVVRLLLASPIFQTPKKNTALDFRLDCPVLAAATSNHHSIVRLLVARGFSVHEESLQYLIYGNADAQMCELFLDLGANPNGASSSPLIAAVDTGKVDILRFLLRRGANPNAKGRPIKGLQFSQLSPLEAAINGQCDYDIVRTLLEGGADVGLAQADGQSYIAHYALNCIDQARERSTRERRWTKFTQLSMQGTELDDAVQEFVRKREAIIPLLEFYPPERKT